MNFNFIPNDASYRRKMRQMEANGFRFSKHNDGEGGSFFQLEGMDPPKTDAPEKKQAAPAPKPKPAPEPKPSEPSTELVDDRKEWERYQPGGDMNPDGTAGAIRYDHTRPGVEAAAKFGYDANADYAKRFLPGLKAQANLEAGEIGRAGGDAIKRFVGKPPELGDPKKLFESYYDKIKSID